MAPDLLYDSRRVYSAFTEDTIIGMRERRDPFGRKITFTHLATIAKAPDDNARKDLIREFFQQGLTVQELKKRVQERRPRVGKPRPHGHRAMLRSIQKCTRKYLGEVALWTDDLYVQLTKAAVQTPQSDLAGAEDLVEDVGQALGIMEQLSQVPQAWIQRLQRVKETLTQGLDKAKASRESELDDDD